MGLRMTLGNQRRIYMLRDCWPLSTDFSRINLGLGGDRGRGMCCQVSGKEKRTTSPITPGLAVHGLASRVKVYLSNDNSETNARYSVLVSLLR